MFVNVSRHNLHLDVRTHTFLSCRLVVYELLHMFHNINYIQTTGCNEKYIFVRKTISLNIFVREGIKQKYLGKCSQNGEGVVYTESLIREVIEKEKVRVTG